MTDLEDRIGAGVGAPGFCEHTVGKTGNGLKELSYYIHDRDAFTERLNAAGVAGVRHHALTLRRRTLPRGLAVDCGKLP